MRWTDPGPAAGMAPHPGSSLLRLMEDAGVFHRERSIAARS